LGRASVLAATFAVGGAAFADLLPPERPWALPRGQIVLDEKDVRQPLGGGSPTLLLPVFTRCGGTCPLTASLLKEALGKARAPFRVVVFSFDPEDGASDLRDFRERFALPASWILVRAAEPGAAREVFDALDFHFMKSGGGFDHPNLTFVFSPRGSWAATLPGSPFSPRDLEAAWKRALTADDPAAIHRLSAWLIRPASWILLACAGLALSLIAILLARLTRRPSPS
jgi:hypothetical protein